MKPKTKIFTGTSGWSYEHWVERFYPEHLKKNEWFPYYTQYFNTVELNMSFYRYPFKNMLKGWKNKMPENFKMTFKANRQITHRKKFHDVEDNMQKFYEMTENLEGNTGCILFQTPPSFQCDEGNFRKMLKFMDVLDSSKNNVIEFRDNSWWNEDVFKLLKAHNVAFCTVSGLEMPSDVKVTADFGYFRFHGPEKPYASKYSEAELKSWAEAIKKEINEKQLNEVYCYFNNDYYGYAIDNAKTLNDMLRQE
jgi:uncharacterized protein YecE (DUF72 family)